MGEALHVSMFPLNLLWGGGFWDLKQSPLAPDMFYLISFTAGLPVKLL